jgi:diguanylate cyclase (GGDEF)-like protein
MVWSAAAHIKTTMTSPVFYILVALTFTSAMISITFFIAWKTLGEKPYALSWAVGFLAATFQWFFNLVAAWFPSPEIHWLTVNALALVLVTLGLRGHCQRTECKRLPNNLWPIAAVVYAAVVWSTVIDKHVGISMAVIPGIAAITLFLSALMILRHREKPRPAEVAAAITMVVFGLAQMTASGMALQQGALGDESFRTLYIHFNFLTLPAGYAGMSMFVIFMLASDLSEQMKEIAIHDQLTDVLNRRGFGEQAAIAFATARRSSRPVSVVMTDIDRFKDINDDFGHAAGDSALCHFANLLKEDRRADDILARMGGEEFALVLPGVELRDAMKFADDLCAKIEASPFQIDDAAMPMTASFGVATISDKDTCMADVVVRADRALYRSKRAGRNRVDLESSQLMLTLDGDLKPVSAA